jgi:hypothetical protein
VFAFVLAYNAGVGGSNPSPPTEHCAESKYQAFGAATGPRPNAGRRSRKSLHRGISVWAETLERDL